MKTLLTAGAIALAASLTTAAALSVDAVAGNQHRPWCPPAPAVDDMWDVNQDARRLCRYNKRMCVQIASNLAYRMAESGAYTDLNDNEFAAFAINVTSHIVDNDYSHDEDEGPPTLPLPPVTPEPPGPLPQ